MFVRRSRLAQTSRHAKLAAKRRRTSKEASKRLESLEERMLLAVGPQLVGIQPNSGDLLLDGDVRNVSPRELSFRLDDSQVIDGATLDGIRITRSGFDGSFEHASATTDFNTNGAVIGEFVAVKAGVAGERITIDIAKSDLGLLTPPTIEVAASTITFTLNTNAASPTTVNDLVVALANSSTANRLVRLDVLAGDSATDIASPAPTYAPLQLHGYNSAQASFDFDTGGAVQIELTAVQEGVAQNGLEVRFTKSNHNNASGPRVTVQDGIVSVDLNQNGLNVSTAGNVVAAINDHLLASQIVEARLTVGLPTVDVTTPLNAGISTPSIVTLDGANDLIVTPGFIGVQPTPDENEVVVRFAEALPDDLYRIEVFGFDDAQLGITALRNTTGDAFMPQSGEFDAIEFELDLGAQVVGVVPQPIERVGGQLVHRRNIIEVYFNDDDLFDQAIATGDLSPDPSVVDPRFYQLIFTDDTVRNTDDLVFNPSEISYDPANDRAVLTFASDLEDLIDASYGGAATYRLRIGTNELTPSQPAPLPPTHVDLTTETSNDFGTGGVVNVTFAAKADFARAVQVNVTKGDLGPTAGPRIEVRDNLISAVLNTNSLALSSAQDLVDAVNSHREASRLVDASLVGTGAFSIAISAPAITTLRVDGFGSSFATASNLNELTEQSLIISSTIDPQEPLIRRVPDADTPGHVDLPLEAVDGFEQHINPTFANDSQAGATTLRYNFRSDYGSDPNGVPLLNFINSEQRERAREALELWGSHLGIQFVETPDSGITFATGDLRVLDAAQANVFADGNEYEVRVDPVFENSMVLMNVNTNWNDDFGGSWFHNVMSGLGFVLGLGRAGDLPNSTIMGLSNAIPEPIYPGDHDIAHGLQLHDTDSNDIDLYRFEINFDDPDKTGQFTAEIFAERQHQASELDTVIALYKEVIVDGENGPVVDWELIARNDDYYSEDSFLELDLSAGVYFIGVTASGNDVYDPTIEDTGEEGRTHGKYDLRLTFRPQVDTSDTITDADRAGQGLLGTSLDGDGDGTPGGTYNFWFQTRPEDRTVYIDKSFNTTSSQPRGTLTNPYNQIDEALDATDPNERVDRGDIIRIVANGGADDDLSTLEDNLAYEIGFSTANDVILSDGSTFNVPQDVTVMIDPGSIFKMRRSRIGVGSSTLGVNRANGALQVLGTPEHQVVFTSYLDQSIGVDTDPSNTTPSSGNWGGLSFRRNLDDAEGRFHYEDVGVFLNYVNQADIRYGGGGNVVVDSNQQIINPIHIVNTRPTITYNTITNSADSAMSAAPNSFEETNFHSFEHQISGAFTSEYQRVGPDIHGNTLRNNSTNALFVRVETPAGGAIRPLTVPGRFDDLDIVHVIAENLPIASTPGGARLETVQPSIDLITFDSQANGNLAPGSYRYKVTFVDANGYEGLPSDATALGTVNPGDGTLQLLNLPAAGGEFVARRIYRSADGGAGPFTLVDDINASSTTFTDTGDDLGGFLRFDPVDSSATAFATVPGGSLNAGDYNYIFAFVDSTGQPTAPSAPTPTFTLDNLEVTAGNRSIELANLPAPFHGEPVRRIYRSLANGSGPYTLVAEIDASLTSFTDSGVSLGEQLPVTAFGVLRPRLDASLVVDPGTVVKLEGSRIDVAFGSQFYAEGFEGQEVIFTSKLDDRYGAGGTFDTNNDDAQGALEATPSPRDWGGFYVGHTSRASIEHAFIGFGGGITKIEGTFKAFNVIEVHSADFRLAHSVVENNSNGQGGQGPADRLGRTANTSATIFVRDSQPLIIDNIFRDNNTGGSLIHINLNSFDADVRGDIGRSTGMIDRVDGLDNNQGPLVRFNRLDNNQLNGMEIRGGTVTGEKVWDDTDIVHVLRSNVIVLNQHQTGGIRLESQPDESLVVKGAGPGSNFDPNGGAGFLVDGTPSNIEDRVGGIIQVVGQPGFPVVMTSLADDAAGAGVQPNGEPQLDTNNDGTRTVPQPNDWRGIRIDRYAHDRNVAWVLEQELAGATAPGVNSTTNTAQNLGMLAPNQKSGDENLRLGWDINGYLNEPNDIDIYSFTAFAGTEIWIDIDDTRNTVDTVIELLNSDGDVLARTDNSFEELRNPSLLVANPGIAANSVNPLIQNTRSDVDQYSTNPRNAGFSITLPGAVGTPSTFFFAVSSADGLTSGVYDMQIRTRESDDFAGSAVRFADIRYSQNAIQVIGHPAHSPLVGEVGENENLSFGAENNNNFNGIPFVPAAGPQIIGNLLEQDRGVLSIAGRIANDADVDFYEFDLQYPSLSAAVNNQLHAAIVLDMDYADGLNRPNTSLWVFDEFGTLILTSSASNIADDRPRLNQSDYSDLSHGSFGADDPYIGAIEMPTGKYFVAVTSNDRVASELLNNPLVRLEPVNSVIRIAEDHIGADGFGGSTAADPVVTVLLDNNSISADATNQWHITDVRAGDPGHGINPSFDGSRSAGGASTLPLAEVEPNDSQQNPQNIDDGPWNLAFSPNIGDLFGNNVSTTIPHITIEGTGDGSRDYYSFTVDQPFSRGIFDIDFGLAGGSGSVDADLWIIDSVSGAVIANNQSAPTTAGAGGSIQQEDAFLEYVFDTPGLYMVVVGQAPTVFGAGTISFGDLDLGQTYTLQVALENHPFTGGGGGGGSTGGQSFYFGDDTTGNYVGGGGASRGSLVSNPFSLEGYSAEDRPVLYFNYFLDTEGDDAGPFANRDAFRVYMVLANGDEHLLATNNSTVGPNPNDDEFDDPDPFDSFDINVQELIDNTGNWLQSRVELDDFAGFGDLRLRFEFDTVDGNDNAHEGVFIDDLIIGFAERGEMVTGANINAAFVPNPDAPGGEIPSGEYQLEIRQANSYAVSTGGVPALQLTHSFDTNDRLVEQLTLIAPAGSELSDEQTFVLSDGGRQLTFEFDNNNSIQPGNTRVLFNATDPAEVIARRIRDAINNPAVQSFLNIEAATGDGRIAGGAASSERVKLFGRADITVESIKGELAAGTTNGNDDVFRFRNDLNQSIVRIEIALPTGFNANSQVRESTLSDDVGAEYTLIGTDFIQADFDNFLAGSEVTFGINIGPGNAYGDQLIGTTVTITLADGTTRNGIFRRAGAGLSGVLDLGGTVIPVLEQGHGDLNLLRDQGQIVIDSNRILDARDFGIVADAGARSPETPQDVTGFGAPHIGPVRNLHDVNDIVDGGLVPGVVISNNEISGEGLGGIHFGGDMRPLEITPPLGIPELGPSVCDGYTFQVEMHRTLVTFEFVDVDPFVDLDGCGAPAAQGDGYETGNTPIHYLYNTDTQDDLARRIRDAFNTSILVTNYTTLHLNATLDSSRWLTEPFTNLPLTSAYASNVVSFAQEFPPQISMRTVPLVEAPQPFGRLINNTIHGHDGNAGFNSGRAPGAPDEPNDRIETAIDTKQGRQAFGETYTNTATIGDSGAIRYDNRLDVDFYQFQLAVNERVRIDIDTNGSGLDSVLRLFNSAGEQVAISEDGAAPGEAGSTDSYIDFVASEKDSYYVGVSASGNDSYDAISLGNRTSTETTGDYTIEIDVLAPRPFVIKGFDGVDIVDGTQFEIHTVYDFDDGLTNDNVQLFVLDDINMAGTIIPIPAGAFVIPFNGEIIPEPGTAAHGPGYNQAATARAIADGINAAAAQGRLPGILGINGIATGSVVADALGGRDGAEGALPVGGLGLPHPAYGLPLFPVYGERFVKIEGAAKIEFLNPYPDSPDHPRLPPFPYSPPAFTDPLGDWPILPVDTDMGPFPLDASVNLDQILRESGILVSERASPTLLNNIFSNLDSGVFTVLSPTTVVGASIFQNNFQDSTIGAANEDFNYTLGNFEPLFVNAPNRDFTPAPFARSIDSAVDSLLERSLFSQYKGPLGISDSPVLAPDRDVTGQLRVDDPDVATPSGQGANVFKDRGAVDRADFVGPGTIITNPRDNDALGLDVNGQTTIIELTEGSLRDFTFQLVDGFESSDPFPGTGVNPDTVRSEAITVFENGRLLEEGIDYTVSFAPTTSLLVIQPVAGVWRRDKIYEVKLNNQDRFVIDLPEVADAGDGDRFSVTDASGDTATFEFDRGYVLDIPETLELLIPTNANRTGGVEDGHRFTITDSAGVSTTFEYDSNGSPGNPLVLANNIPIFIADAFTPELVAEATVAALQGAGIGLLPKTLLGGRVHVGAPDGYRIDTTFAPTLELPASTLGIGVPIQGALVVIDAQTFSITDPDGNTTRFEFELGLGVAANNIPIAPTGLDQLSIAAAIETAINGTIGLDITAVDLGNGMVHLGLDDGYSLDLETFNVFRLGLARLVNDMEIMVADDGTGLVTFEFDNNGISSANVAIPFTAADTHEELAEKIADAFRQSGLGSLAGATHLGDGRVQLGGNPGDLLDVSAVMGAFPLGIFPGLNVVGTPGVTPSLSIQTPVDGGLAPTGVTDGETFTISNGVASVTFEFNLATDINVTPGNRPIIFTPTSTQAEVAASIAGAIRSSGIGLNAFVEPMGVVNLDSTIKHSLDITGAPSLGMFGVPGGAVSMPIPADPTFTQDDLARLVIDSINGGPLTAVASSPRGGSTIFVDGAISISDGIENFFVQAIADKAGNPLKPNQPTDETAFTIVTPPTPLPPGSVVDYGDAPDGIGGFNYPTLQASNGAVHLIGADAIFLGGGVDAELDGQPTLAADGDDTLNIVAGVDLSDSTLMQPDGVILLVVPNAGGGVGGVTDEEFFTISEDGVTTVFEFDNDDIVASNSVVAFDSMSSAFDIAEAIKEALDLELPGLNATVVGGAVQIELSAAQSVNTLNTSVVQRPLQPIQIEVPVAGGAAINEGDTFVISTPAATIRFEFTTDSMFDINNRPIIYSPNDTRDEIAQTIVEAILDTNLGLVPAAIGNGLIVIDGDDEDGVEFRGALNSNTITQVTVTASEPGRLDAWIDYNQDGDWNDPGEKVFSNLELSAGENALSIRAPATALFGDTYARFRFSAAGNLLPTGLALTGEVEDYVVTVVSGFPPTAVNDLSYTTDENTPLVVDGVTDPSVLDNDIDPDLQTLIVGEYQVTSVFGATVTVNADGTFTYDPTTSPIFNALDDGETLFDSFTYAAYDGADPASNDGLYSNTATVGITVMGVNDGPITQPDGPYTTDEDTTLNVDAVSGLLVNDSDVEGDPLTALMQTVSSSRGATVSIFTDGSFSYDPSTSTELQTLAPTETLDDTFIYQAFDGDTFSSGTATVTVAGVNDAPTANPDDLGHTTDEDSPANFPLGILTNDTDPEGDIVIVGSLGTTTSAEGATVTINANGSYNYDPRTSASLQTLAAGASRVDTFTYTASDGLLNSAPTTVSVTVTGVNDAPTANPDTTTTTEDDLLEITSLELTFNDLDIDIGDTLTVTLLTGTSGLGAPISVAAGIVSYDPTNVPVLQSLRPGQQLNDSFVYRITDGSGATDTATVTVTVTGVSDAPQAIDDAFTVSEDVLLDIDAPGVLVNDVNVEGDGMVVTQRQFLTPRGATVQIFADGRITYDPRSATSLQALGDGQSVDDTFAYTVSDFGGAADTATVTVTVTGANDAPVANNDSFTVEQGLIFVAGGDGVLANDFDPEGTQVTAIEVVSSPTRGTVTLNADGSFTYDHDDTPAAIVPTDSFTYRIEDESGATATATVTLNIIPRMFPWQNPRNEFDVNDDGNVTIADAFDIIAELRANGIRALETDLPATIGPAFPAPYVDVDGNNLITLTDALLVTREVKWLMAEPEGEAEAKAAFGVSEQDTLANSGALRPVKLAQTSEGEGVAEIGDAEGDYAVPGAGLPALENSNEQPADAALADGVLDDELDLDPIVGDIASQWTSE